MSSCYIGCVIYYLLLKLWHIETVLMGNTLMPGKRPLPLSFTYVQFLQDLYNSDIPATVYELASHKLFTCEHWRLVICNGASVCITAPVKHFTLSQLIKAWPQSTSKDGFMN